MIGFVIRNFRGVCMIGGFLGVCGTVFFMGNDMLFNFSAVAVDASVDEVKVECYLKKTERVSRRRKKTTKSDLMSCDKAEELMKVYEAEGFTLEHETTTYVAYTAPDGTRQAQWSRMTTYAGHDLKAGEHIKLLVDPAEPAKFRKPTTLADMGIYFLVMLGSALTSVGAWYYGGSTDEYT